MEAKTNGEVIYNFKGPAKNAYELGKILAKEQNTGVKEVIEDLKKKIKEAKSFDDINMPGDIEYRRFFVAILFKGDTSKYQELEDKFEKSKIDLVSAFDRVLEKLEGGERADVSPTPHTKVEAKTPEATNLLLTFTNKEVVGDGADMKIVYRKEPDTGERYEIMRDGEMGNKFVATHFDVEGRKDMVFGFAREIDVDKVNPDMTLEQYAEMRMMTAGVGMEGRTESNVDRRGLADQTTEIARANSGDVDLERTILLTTEESDIETKKGLIGFAVENFFKRDLKTIEDTDLSKQKNVSDIRNYYRDLPDEDFLAELQSEEIDLDRSLKLGGNKEIDKFLTKKREEVRDRLLRALDKRIAELEKSARSKAGGGSGSAPGTERTELAGKSREDIEKERIVRVIRLRADLFKEKNFEVIENLTSDTDVMPSRIKSVLTDFKTVDFYDTLKSSNSGSRQIGLTDQQILDNQVVIDREYDRVSIEIGQKLEARIGELKRKGDLDVAERKAREDAARERGDEGRRRDRTEDGGGDDLGGNDDMPKITPTTIVQKLAKFDADHLAKKTALQEDARKLADEILEMQQNRSGWKWFVGYDRKQARKESQLRRVNAELNKIMRDRIKYERDLNNDEVLARNQLGILGGRADRRQEVRGQRENVRDLKTLVRDAEKGEDRFDAKEELRRFRHDTKLEARRKRQEKLDDIKQNYQGRWGKYWNLTKEHLKSRESWANAAYAGGILAGGLALGVAAPAVLAAAGLTGLATSLGTAATVSLGAATGAVVGTAMDMGRNRVRKFRDLDTGTKQEEEEDKKRRIIAVLVGAATGGLGAGFSNEISSGLSWLWNQLPDLGISNAFASPATPPAPTSTATPVSTPPASPASMYSGYGNVYDPVGVSTLNTLEIPNLYNTEHIFRAAFDGLEGFGSLSETQKLAFVQNVEGNLFSPSARIEVKEAVMSALNVPRGGSVWNSILDTGYFRGETLDQVIKGGTFNANAIEDLLSLKLSDNSGGGRTFFDAALAAARKVA